MTITAEITDTVTRYSEQDKPSRRFAIIENGEIVSALWLDLETGEILNVETDETRQGEGLASQLYRYAVARTDVFHAPEAHRTYAGQRFAASVGGPSLDCHYGCCDTDTDDDTDDDF